VPLTYQIRECQASPPKKTFPRQAGQAQAFIWGLKWKRIEHYMRYHKIQKIVQQIFVGLFGDLCK
jgi:hypothetical protein